MPCVLSIYTYIYMAVIPYVSSWSLVFFIVSLFLGWIIYCPTWKLAYVYRRPLTWNWKNRTHIITSGFVENSPKITKKRFFNSFFSIFVVNNCFLNHNFCINFCRNIGIKNVNMVQKRTSGFVQKSTKTTKKRQFLLF